MTAGQAAPPASEEAAAAALRPGPEIQAAIATAVGGAPIGGTGYAVQRA